MHMVPETVAEMAWWALGINLATFVMACVHRIHTLTLSEAITDTQCQPPFPLCPHTWQGVQKQGYMEISPVWGRNPTTTTAFSLEAMACSCMLAK